MLHALWSLSIAFWMFWFPQYVATTFTPTAVSGSVSLVQYAVSTGGDNPVFSTQNTTTGNTIVYCISWAGTLNTQLSSLSDGTNSYTVIAASFESAGGTHYSYLNTQCGYAKNITGGSEYTVTGSVGGAQALSSAIFELSGASISAPYDQSSGGTGTGSAGQTMSAGSVTTSEAKEFGITILNNDDGFGGGNQFTAGSNWTLILNHGGGSDEQGSEYQQQSAAGTLTGNATGNSGAWVASMVVFKW